MQVARFFEKVWGNGVNEYDFFFVVGVAAVDAGLAVIFPA